MTNPEMSGTDLNDGGANDEIRWGRWVEIEFECLPIRSITRFDIPIDASPAYEQFVQRVKAAVQKHGSLNSYYLHRGLVRFHLTNHPTIGGIEFEFEGTALTDRSDTKVRHLDLSIQLGRESCDWLNESVVRFFETSAKRAIAVEFDRYIAAGDLQQTKARLEAIDRQAEASSGYIGMYL